MKSVMDIIILLYPDLSAFVVDTMEYFVPVIPDLNRCKDGEGPNHIIIPAIVNKPLDSKYSSVDNEIIIDLPYARDNNNININWVK